jgi:hypothetical protein
MARAWTGETERAVELTPWERVKAGTAGVATAAGWATTASGPLAKGITAAGTRVVAATEKVAVEAKDAFTAIDWTSEKGSLTLARRGQAGKV